MTQVKKINHMRYPVQLSLGGSGFDRETVWDVYSRLERRAVSLMSGWEVVLGVTPDDLAQVALREYLELRTEGRESEEARTLASFRLQRDVRDLFQKSSNNPSSFFEEMSPLSPEDGEDDPGEQELTAAEQVAMYFSDERMDWISYYLSPRESEAVILRYESDLDLHGVATSMGVGYETAKTLVKRALKKLRAALSP